MNDTDRRTVRRPVVVATFGAVVAAAVTVVAPTQAAAPYLPACTSIAVSPNYTRDHTLVCTWQTRPPVVPKLAVSTNRGKSWTPAKAAGLTYPADSALGFPFDPILSPRFAEDHLLIVGTPLGGLQMSTDLGASFHPLDGLVTVSDRTNPVAFMAATPAPLAPVLGRERLFLAFAADGRSARVDVAAALHQPVPGAPISTYRFVAPATTGSQGTPLALAIEQVGDAGRTVVYRCTVELACLQRLAAFPEGYGAPRAWHVDGGATLVVRLRNTEIGDLGLWRSTDGGASFTRWAAVDRVLAPVLATSDEVPFVNLAVNANVPRVMYLSVTAVRDRKGWRTNSPPAQQLFRSTDAGAHWTRIGYQRDLAQPGPRGSLPWDGTIGTDAGSFTLTPDGRLLVGAEFRVDAMPVESIHCSVDGGVHWSRACVR